jgi:vesicle-fusing ATPase
VFNVSLHVPALRVDEVMRVLKGLNVFEPRDIPEAMDALGSHVGKTIPMKKLLLWVEMAKQVGVLLAHLLDQNIILSNWVR